MPPEKYSHVHERERPSMWTVERDRNKRSGPRLAFKAICETGHSEDTLFVALRRKTAGMASSTRNQEGSGGE